MANTLIPLGWKDDNKDRRYGAGVSRPASLDGTRDYRLVIKEQGASKLIWTAKAESLKHAIKYAEARWPGASIQPAETRNA